MWFEPGYGMKISPLFNMFGLSIIQKSANINCVFGFSEGERERELVDTMRTSTCAKFLQVNQVTAACRDVVCRQLQNLMSKISQIHF